MKRERSQPDGGIVWSSDHGRTCPDCGAPLGSCRCRQGETTSAVPTKDGVVRVARESKGRRGKTVTIITGLVLPSDGLEDIARALKKRCGTGGTIRGGVIEIQGDQRETVVAELEKRGWKVKRAGG